MVLNHPERYAGHICRSRNQLIDMLVDAPEAIKWRAAKVLETAHGRYDVGAMR